MKKTQRNILKPILGLLLCMIGMAVCAPMVVWAEEETNCANCESTYENGFCACEGTASYEEPAKNSNGAYEIGNAGELYWFME